MSLSGNLEDMSLQDILQIIHHSKKSGTLRLAGSRGDASIVFCDGAILEAHGDISAQEPPDPRQSREGRIASVVRDLLSWTDGTFDLTLHDVAQSDRKHPGIDTQHLLLAALRGPSEAPSPRPPDVTPSDAEVAALCAEMREQEEPSSITLSLLRTLTPYFDRAILFAVTGGTLTPLGAYGRGRAETPISSLVKELVLPIEAGTPLSRALRTGRAFLAGEGSIAPGLTTRIGRPRSGRVGLLPFVFEDRPVALLYVDQGETMHNLDFLEGAESRLPYEKLCDQVAPWLSRALDFPSQKGDEP